MTGEEVARVSSAGIDLGAALDYGRRVGGPALRALTFHDRAALAKAVGLMLREHRDELYALSARTGATLGDSKFDVDGGIGVLLSYASKAKRELPNDTVYAEGAVEPLSRGGQFVGQHILTPLLGVAVQVNAFNFPVWGPLEKLAPALIAGVPTLVKLALQTAYLTARLVELIDESGILPAGAVQLLCGSAPSPGSSRRAGPAELHRLRLDCAATAGAPQRGRPLGAVQRRSGLAQLLDPRPGRHPWHPRVRLVRQAARHRDDSEGRAEMHGDPPGVRTSRAAE